MALPTSTIVMALVTAVPFGLAIKDTVNAKPEAPSEAYLKAEATLEGIDTASREQEAASELRKLAIDTAIEKLAHFGRPAELGVPYAIGAKLADDHADVELLERDARAMFDYTLDRDESLKTVTITFPQYDSDHNICLLVSQRLDEAWGDSTRTFNESASRKHWARSGLKKPHQRATLLVPDDSSRCELLVE